MQGDEPEHTIPLRGSAFGLFSLSIAGIIVAFGISLLCVLADDGIGRPGGALVVLIVSELGLWAGFFGTCKLASRSFGSGSLSSDFGLKFRWRDAGAGTLGALISRVLSAIATVLVVEFAPRIISPDSSLARAVATSGIGWLVFSIIVCIGAPFFEELYFRGLLQTQLVQRLGAGKGIVVASILFAALHIANAPGIPGLELAGEIAPVGFVLGYVRYRTGRLGSSMVAHSLFNALAVIALAASIAR